MLNLVLFSSQDRDFSIHGEAESSSSLSFGLSVITFLLQNQDLGGVFADVWQSNCYISFGDRMPVHLCTSTSGPVWVILFFCSVLRN